MESEACFTSERKEENKLGIANSSNENVQEVMDQEVFVANEVWTYVGKKVKSKKRRNRISIGDIGYVEDSLSSIDCSLGNTPSVKNVREVVIERDKERREGGESKKSLLETSEKSRTDTHSIRSIIHTQKISTRLPIKPDSENNNIPFTLGQDITHIISSSAVKVKSSLKDQCLKQSAIPKTPTSSITNIGNAEKASVRLLDANLDSEKRNSISVEKEETAITIISENQVPSSYVDFDQESNVFSDEFYNPLGQSVRVGSGVFFEENVQYNKSPIYKKIAVEYCNQLRQFRKLHFDYCVKLINRIFKIKDNKLVVSKDVSDLFKGLTPHTGILFFILKIFFLVNFSTLFGDNGKIARLRYSSTYFYDQSLLDLLVSEVIINASKVVMDGPQKEKNQLKEIFETRCKDLYNADSYEPQSGEFFRKIFSICHSLASAELSEEEQELVDFAMLTCIVYCGHMVSMLCRMLFYNYDVGCVGSGSLVSYLNTRSFCIKCRDLRKAFIHMYHPTKDIGKCLRNVNGVINMPLMVWRNCTEEINDLVIESANQGNLNFGTFVGNMISRIKRLVLLPNTMRYYEDNIKMYDTELRTVGSLLPLPNQRPVYSTKNL
ncbi:DUF3514 domain-containing protein [Ehrlichia sp. JZT12]